MRLLQTVDLLSSESGDVVWKGSVTFRELSVLCNKVAGIGHWYLVPQRSLETSMSVEAGCSSWPRFLQRS